MFRSFRLAALGLIAASAVATLGPTSASSASADGFSALKGGWSGGGRALFAGGQTEKLRCSARYSGGRSNLLLTLRCASPSATINLTGNLGASGKKVVGDWSESTYGATGTATGSMTGSGIRLKISGGLGGYLNISVAGSRQTVALSSQGTLTGVNISMRRR